jgi:hypothetical protein
MELVLSSKEKLEILLVKFLSRNLLLKIFLFQLYFLVFLLEFLGLNSNMSLENLRFFFFLFNLFLILIILNYRKDIYRGKISLSLNIYVLTILTSFCLSLFKGFAIAPNVYDAMTYHLPRIFSWINSGNLNFFYTPNPRQNEVPPLASYILLLVFSLTGSDRFLFLLSFISIVITSFLIYKIIFTYTKNDFLCYVGVLLFIFSPTAVGFSSDVYVDAFGTFLSVLVLYCYIQLSKTGEFYYFYLALFLAPLLLLSKTNSAILVSVIYVFMIFSLNKKLLNHIRGILLVLIITIPFALPFLIRLFNQITVSGGVLITNFNYKAILFNMIKNLLTLIQTPVPFLNKYLEDTYQLFTLLLGSKTPIGNFDYYGEFYVNSDIGIDAIGSPILWTLSFAAILILIHKRRNRNLVYIFLSQLSLLLAVFIWQPWISRFSLPVLALGSILFSVALATLKFKTLQVFSINSILLLTVGYGSFWHFYQPGKSLFNPKPLYVVANKLGLTTNTTEGLRHDLNLPRSSQYFAFKQKIEGSYLGAIQMINKNKYKVIYVVSSTDDIEFPIYSLTNYKVPLVHLETKHSQIELLPNDKSSVILCTFRCFDLNYDKVYESKFVTLFQGKILS